MQVITADGVTRPAGVSTTWQCVPESRLLPSTWQRGNRYAGGLEVVMPRDARTLVVAPSWSPGGWEWPIV